MHIARNFFFKFVLQKSKFANFVVHFFHLCASLIIGWGEGERAPGTSVEIDLRTRTSNRCV